MEVIAESHGVRCSCVQRKSRHAAAFVEQNFSTTEIPIFFLLPIIFIHKKPTKQQQQKKAKPPHPTTKTNPNKLNLPKEPGRLISHTHITDNSFQPCCLSLWVPRFANMTTGCWCWACNYIKPVMSGRIWYVVWNMWVLFRKKMPFSSGRRSNM